MTRQFIRTHMMQGGRFSGMGYLYLELKNRLTIRRISKFACNASPARVLRMPHAQNSVYRLKYRHINDKIIKICHYRKDSLLLEQNAIKQLTGLGFNVPEVNLTQAYMPGFRGTFTLMERFEGIVLTDFCRVHGMEAAHFLNSTGMFVAQLGKLQGALLHDMLGDEHDRQFSYSHLQKTVAAYVPERSLRTIKAKWEQFSDVYFNYPMEMLTHGDFHAYQILVGPQNRLLYLDWENLRIGRWQYDMGSFLLTLGVFGGLDVNWALEQIFNGFLPGESLSRDDRDEVFFWMRTLAFHGLILRIERKQPTEYNVIRSFLLQHS